MYPSKDIHLEDCPSPLRRACTSCFYPKPPISGSDIEKAASPAPSAPVDLSLLPDANERAIAAARFLDPELYYRSLAGVSIALQATNHIPTYVRDLVIGGDVSQKIVTSYYQLAHPWLPIISKRKVHERLLNPLLPIRIDTAFLLLCMRLLASSYDKDKSPDSSLEYRAAIQCFMEIQRSGIATPEVLQSCILLSVYEWGHAIYPAAEISISASLRYALSLGMSWDTAKEDVPALLWIDKEEERRTLWAIYVLERVAKLGKPQQTLLVPEAEMSSPLPCDDADWESQTTTETIYLISSPPAAILTLHMPYLQPDQSSELRQKARDSSENAAVAAMKMAQEYITEDPTNLCHGDISPFVIPWIYLAGVWFIHERAAEHLSVIYDALSQLDVKWKSAGMFASICTHAK
ncbi:fungal-specific transcription factor domain-containing protein [Trichoderma velutinum]